MLRAALTVLALFVHTTASLASTSEGATARFTDLSARDIGGAPVDFRRFAGKVVLVTNVASA
jgi:hypothetical protein